MSNPVYSCCNENRRANIAGNPTLNGIDYLELADDSLLPPTSPPQQTLLVYCLKTAPTDLTQDNTLIIGGESITGITAAWVLPASTVAPAPPNTATSAELTYFNGLNNADQILVVEGGRIVERGNHAELYAAKGRYYDLYTRQHGLEANLFLAPGEGDKVDV